ncbi:MAG: NAD(P)/FAD-dependent oxidoreductase [Magnetovibrionaceae bacterium]
MTSPQSFDAVIIGAGAAGLMCAMTAAGRGQRVCLIDHADRPGKKILISGGGRCNFTNLHCAADRFLSANRHFCKSALARFTQKDFLALVEKHRIPWHEKTLGQLFCDTSAKDIVKMLLTECEAAGVDLWLNTSVTEVAKAERFRIETDRGRLDARALVLATGGLSIPKMGATGFGHDLARQFGLGLTEVRPGLVPLTLCEEDKALVTPLSGVATPTVARIGKTRFEEALLFTHRGLSGPAILQISSYWREGKSLSLDLLPGLEASTGLLGLKAEQPKLTLGQALARHLPNRLAAALADHHGPSGPIGQAGDKALRRVGAALNDWRLTPAGSEGYAKAEVTLGGVDTRGLSSKTMEAKTVSGLYFIGEAVDVTGWLGGYNFQWAWSSGHAAGLAIAEAG